MVLGWWAVRLERTAFQIRPVPASPW